MKKDKYMELYEYLDNYKEMTLQLISKVNEDNDINELLDQRAKILDEIKKINFYKEEINENKEVISIFELDKKLEILLKKKKAEVKKQIDIIRKNREARKKYNGINGNLKIFSAKG
ncbi:flagellar protein FliT [Clostridium beijerinckii]|mgnify:CR=1 FL=1|jgi:hypothetical protein|nr:flagellar protein FliT [Clostridium beijerinckii]NSA61129.1 hypothetical protein [Clostridium beijerinckii]NYC52094.1 hypothetical protein [Clostridium beijerinckii]QUF73401.1 flagellar protein FliT [Clostridium beijerinckii]